MAQVIATGFGLPEAPCWHEGRLYVADASAGGVWDVPLDGSDRVAVVPHRRGIAGLAVHAEGGFVVGGRSLAWKHEEDTIVLVDERCNDLIASPAGRVYVGTMHLDERATSATPGQLLMVDLDATVTVMADVTLSNGLAFSPDGRRLYHVDSGPRLLRAYDVRDDGSLGPWSEVHRWDDGIPDGAAVAEDGTVWVAISGAGCVSRLDPDGAERARIPMPHPDVTSLCFGGESGTDLFVTMGGDLEAARCDGFVVRLDVGPSCGVERHQARVRPSDGA